MGTNLQKRSRESTTTETPSSRDLELARLLDLACQITGKELTPGEAEFWKQELRAYPEKTVDWAFREHLRRSRYFPTLAPILELIREFRAQACSYTGPLETDEDRRRKAAGWRQYGVPDVQTLVALQETLWKKKHKPSSDEEINSLLVDLDRRIDQFENNARR